MYLGNLFVLNIKLRHQPVDHREQFQEVARFLFLSFILKNRTELLYEGCATLRLSTPAFIAILAEMALWSALAHQEIRLDWYLDGALVLLSSGLTGSFSRFVLKSNFDGV